MATTKTIAVFNQAGGVGKTTVTHNLAFHLAERGHKVLAVDMDPQGSLTDFFGLDLPSDAQTIYDALMSDVEEPSLPIHQNLDGVDLLPSDILLANVEQELVAQLERELRLKEILTSATKNYAFILIDCPPSLGLLSIISLIAATHVLVPIHTQHKAFKGTASLLKTIAKVQKRLNKSLRIAGFVPTIYAAANIHDQNKLQDIKEQLSAIAPILSPIPRATAIAEASGEGKPLALCSVGRNKPIVALFEQLAAFIEELQ